MFLSVFDLFKIGIGPSSSHTMGPMTAAGRFLDEVLSGEWPRPAGATIEHIAVSLHGSLAYTGLGHASDRAIILGLTGVVPETVDPDKMDEILDGVAKRKAVSPPGHPT
jgi:L-serine dehydratase